MAAKRSEYEEREVIRDELVCEERGKMKGELACKERRANLRTRIANAILSQEGMGVVEVILIIVVLIGLVIIFQTNIKGVVASIFETIEKNAKSIK